MLDLSSAFDTVDHFRLSVRLQEVGVMGQAHHWFKSYLEDRLQRVDIQGQRSGPVRLDCGVPQGLVLCPQLFSLYIAPLARIIRKHGLDYYFFADEGQIYLFMEPVQRCARESSRED